MFPEGCRKIQQCNVWHVLLARVNLLICWPNQRVYKVKLFLPPLMVPNTQASSIYYQLYQHPWNATIFTALRVLSDACGISVCHLESDAAYSNQRMIAFLLTRTGENELMSSWLCSLHQIQLTEVAISSSVGSQLISRIYSLTLVLRANGAFAKMLGALRGVIAGGLAIESIAAHGPPPERCREIHAEIANYACFHYRRLAKAGSSRVRHHHLEHIDLDAQEADEDVEDEDRGSEEFKKKVEEYMRVWNGPWWRPGEFIHDRGGHACCDREGPKCTLERLVRTALAVPFRQVPLTPAANKWSKLGPCIDVLMFACLCHQLFVLLFATLPIAAHAEDATDEAAHDHAYTSDINYQAVQGRRYKRAMETLNSADCLFAMRLLAVVTEPIRTLTAWLMRRAKESQDEMRRPCLLDFSVLLALA